MRTIRLSPLSRVEGHGRVDLVLEEDRLHEVRLAITESPRLFEGLVLGRPFAEIPALVCRICAICSSVHRIAAAGALEQALQITIPEAARWIRELLLLGGHIESHALHLFCLVYPDIAGTQSLLELVREGDTVASRGLALKALGNRIQTVAGGRTIHPVNVEVGGILKVPDRDALVRLEEDLTRWQQELSDLLAPFAKKSAYPPSNSVPAKLLSILPSEELSLQGETLFVSDGRTIEADRYRELLAEKPVSYSNARQSGTDEDTYLVGAWARRQNAIRIGLPMGEGPMPPGIFANNAAQAEELIAAVARARDLTGRILGLPPDSPLRVVPHPAPGKGTLAIEAPRGLLVHQYVLDDMGRVAAADVVTPTAINQRAMEQQLLTDLEPVTSRDELDAGAQKIVRAFDPCISCSVHVLDLKRTRIEASLRDFLS